MAISIKSSQRAFSKFKIIVDEDTGAITIFGEHYNFNTAITMTLDELPDRYKAYFANFKLCEK